MGKKGTPKKNSRYSGSKKKIPNHYGFPQNNYF